jgi:hypothetical protein
MKEGGCLESRFVFSQFDLSTEQSMRSKHDLARPQVGEMHAHLCCLQPSPLLLYSATGMGIEMEYEYSTTPSVPNYKNLEESMHLKFN